MDKKQTLLVELVLYDTIKAFHDCDDKQKRNRYIKSFTLIFCKENGIDPLEAVDKLNEIFKLKRSQSQFPYQHYDNGKLEKIIFSGKKTPTKKKTEEDIEYSD